MTTVTSIYLLRHEYILVGLRGARANASHNENRIEACGAMLATMTQSTEAAEPLTPVCKDNRTFYIWLVGLNGFVFFLGGSAELPEAGNVHSFPLSAGESCFRDYANHSDTKASTLVDNNFK